MSLYKINIYHKCDTFNTSYMYFFLFMMYIIGIIIMFTIPFISLMWYCCSRIQFITFDIIYKVFMWNLSRAFYAYNKSMFIMSSEELTMVRVFRVALGVMTTLTVSICSFISSLLTITFHYSIKISWEFLFWVMAW